MKKTDFLNKCRRASVSVEVALSIVLGVAVLFLIIGLVNDNLSEMTAHSGFNKLFQRDAAAEYEMTGRSYTDSQVTQDTAGQQGLEWYLAEAQKGIDKLKLKSETVPPIPPATSSLTTYDQIAVAKCFTVKSMIRAWQGDNSEFPTEENDLARDAGFNDNNARLSGFIYSVVNLVCSDGSNKILEITWRPNSQKNGTFFMTNSLDTAGKINYLRQVLSNFDNCNPTMANSTCEWAP